MTTSEQLTISLAIVSLAVSMWAAFRASRFSSHEIRLARRLELHTLLMDVDRERLHDPSLNRMFRSSDSKEKLPPKDKQEIYITMYLNVFEAAHSIFRETKGLSKAEQEVEEAWTRFLTDFLEDCTPAIGVWNRYRETYYASFQVFVDKKIQGLAEGESARPQD